jgi:outer membrane protein
MLSRLPRAISLALAATTAVAGVASVATAQSSDTLRLSVEDAVTRAIRASDETRLAAANIDVADAQIITARAAGLPQVRLGGNYTQTIKNARAQIVSQVFGQAFTYNANANVSQTLFQGGRIFAGSRGAGDTRAALRHTQTETRALVAVNAQRTYLEALFAAELVGIQERNFALADDRLKQVEQLEAAGRAARYDVLRARVERANLEPTLLQARNTAELALLSVKQLLNLPVDQPLVLTSALDSKGLEDLVTRTVADSTSDPTRSAIQAAEYVLEARKEGIKVARADLFPTVTASFQTGYLALPSSNGFPTLWGRTSGDFCVPPSTTRNCQNNGWFSDRNFGIQVAWPLFDGLRAKGNIDLAQAQERVARVQLEQQREAVAVERSRARAEFQRARSAFDARRQNAAEAEEAFKLANLRFTRGLGTQLEVSDAQLALLTAQTNELRAVYDLYLSIAELARSRGVAIPLPPTQRSAR